VQGISPKSTAVDVGPFRSPPAPNPDAASRTSESEVWLRHVVEVLGRAGKLTRAEREVLEPLLLGRGYTEIATILHKSPHTVGVQVKAILRRLHASSSRDLLRVFLCELDRVAPRSADTVEANDHALESDNDGAAARTEPNLTRRA